MQASTIRYFQQFITVRCKKLQQISWFHTILMIYCPVATKTYIDESIYGNFKIYSYLAIPRVIRRMIIFC